MRIQFAPPRGTAPIAALLVLPLAGPPAAATEGYFQYGYGARQKALAGAGVRGALAPSIC